MTDKNGQKKHNKKFIITSAQHLFPTNKEFLKTLDHYCDTTGAELLILPTKGHYASKKVDDYIEGITQADEFSAHNIITDNTYSLNDKIHIRNFDLIPQQIDPLTGLGRFTQSDASTIVGSPKQRLKVIPNSNIKLPKVLMSTGSVSKPNYQYNRIGNMAYTDHVNGAIIVEIEDDRIYHFRKITALKNGSFFDLSQKYNGNHKPQSARPEAIVLGDWHTGDTNEQVRHATYKMIDEYAPKTVVLHDFFNGHSINHHNQGKLVELVKDYNQNSLSLEDELKLCADDLEEFINKVPKHTNIVIVASNHNEFLNRYLQEARLIKEPQNTRIASKLLAAYCEDKDPVEEGIRMFIDLPKNVKFLQRDEDYKVYGWQLGSHGDLGASGKKGDISSKEDAYGKSITGHSHTPHILRNTYIVGTSTNLKLRYNRGPSSWMNTHALLYPDGNVQLINIINGKYQR